MSEPPTGAERPGPDKVLQGDFQKLQGEPIQCSVMRCMSIVLVLQEREGWICKWRQGRRRFQVARAGSAGPIGLRCCTAAAVAPIRHPAVDRASPSEIGCFRGLEWIGLASRAWDSAATGNDAQQHERTH
jgi:hypothetical protein